jgi:hypothetical protein
VAAAKPKGCPFSRTQFVLDDSLRAVFALGSDRSRTRDVDVGLIKRAASQYQLRRALFT